MNITPKWKRLAKYLFNELKSHNDDFMDIEDVRYYYDKTVTELQYKKATEYINALINNARFYCVENRELMIELHDNHTLWNISVPEYCINPELEYCNLIEEKCDEFTERTGIEIGCYGRSGRHICIDYNFENLEHYSTYKKLAEKLENEVIKYYQNYLNNNCA